MQINKLNAENKRQESKIHNEFVDLVR